MVKAGRRSVAELSEATIKCVIAGPRPLVEGRVAIPVVPEVPHGASRPEGSNGSAGTFSGLILPSPRRLPSNSPSAA
jgi:hypothetical protein